MIVWKIYEQKRSESYGKAMTSHFRHHILPSLGEEVPLADVSDADLRDFRAYLGSLVENEELDGRSCNRVLTSLRQLYKYAEQRYGLAPPLMPDAFQSPPRKHRTAGFVWTLRRSPISSPTPKPEVAPCSPMWRTPGYALAPRPENEVGVDRLDPIVRALSRERDESPSAPYNRANAPPSNRFGSPWRHPRGALPLLVLVRYKRWCEARAPAVTRRCESTTFGTLLYPIISTPVRRSMRSWISRVMRAS